MEKSIYEISEPGDDSWIPTTKIETLLKQSLMGVDLSTYPIKTRSKIVKTAVCEVLGYKVLKSF